MNKRFSPNETIILASMAIIVVNLGVLILYDTKKTVELIDLKEKIQKENIVKIFIFYVCYF